MVERVAQRWQVSLWAVVGSLLLFHMVALSAKPDPRTIVERTSNEVLQILEDHGEEIAGDPVRIYEAVAPVIQPHIDFEGIGARMLGPHWRRADPETRDAFVREFQRSLLRTYGSSMDDFDGVEVRVLGSRARDGGVQVGMEVGGGEHRARVLFSFEEREAAWKIVDIVAEGVSMVHNFREDFRVRLRDQDLEEVVAEMTARNREIGFE